MKKLALGETIHTKVFTPYNAGRRTKFRNDRKYGDF